MQCFNRQSAPDRAKLMCSHPWGTHSRAGRGRSLQRVPAGRSGPTTGPWHLLAPVLWSCPQWPWLVAGSLLGNPWLHFVRTLPKGVEVPHAPLDVPCQHFISQACSQASPFGPMLILEESGPQIRGVEGGQGRQAGFTGMGSVHTAM